MFVAELARGLRRQDVDVTVYTIGESTIEAPIRWLYPTSQWPVNGELECTLKALNHSAWAVAEAAGEMDLVHVNSAPALSFSRFIDIPMVHTVHHTYDQAYAEFYESIPEVAYVTISNAQRSKLRMPRMRTIHHGIDASLYTVGPQKRQYLSFLGRIAPPKGTHLAIEVAKKAGIPLKIAGEIQPAYKSYWESMVKPHVDGKFIEYVGEVSLPEKNELLRNSVAMLFPIQWNEPFGLVMIEAMACGTPVLATPGGSVVEVVEEGLSGHVRSTVDDLARCAVNLDLDPESIRAYMEKYFSVERMTRGYINLYTEILQNGVTEEEQIVA